MAGVTIDKRWRKARLFEVEKDTVEAVRGTVAVGKRFLDAFDGVIVRGEWLDLAELALNEVKTGGLPDWLFRCGGRETALA